MPSEPGLKGKENFARSLRWWESGDKLYKIPEHTEIMYKILDARISLGEDPLLSPDSQSFVAPFPKG